ncbi:IclR family transcriptional regulator [Dermacoccaceae bacterium W4C1]
MADSARGTGVQSVSRALDVLEVIDAAGGEVTLSEISATSGLPMPTIHRLVRTLVDRSYLRQLPDRRYALGTRLIPLGNAAREAFGSRSTRELATVVRELGETTNLATLDGDQLVYVGQVPSPRAMRMFTELGQHVHPHCRAAGKALLAQLDDAQARGVLERVGMPAMTPRTVTDIDELVAQLAQIREQGFATEDGEMELGVRCLAVPVPSAAARFAVSLSAPETRMTDAVQQQALPVLTAVAQRLADQLGDVA